MNKLLNRLKKREGFTLVECIVAVAVFAVMVLLVFAILTRATEEAKMANKSEEDLTHLIDNVVSDETYKKFREEYDASGNLLNAMQLNIAGSSSKFNITYNVIDGYKNFVVCPSCGHFADNSVFMGSTPKENFGNVVGTAQAYLCPSCATSFSQTLMCDDCENTGSSTIPGNFTYIPSTGGFSCNSCGSTAVKGTDIDDKVTSDAKMAVSGIVPNAIAYGSVKRPTDLTELVTYSGINETTGTAENFTDGSVSMNLTYEASSNQSLPGTYTLTITPNKPANAASNGLNLELKLPPHYKFQNLTEVTTAGTLVYTSGDSSDNAATLNYTFNATSQYKIKFQFVNYKSGFSFEYDYNDATDAAQGLAEYWFGLNGSHATPRDSAGYVTKFSANGQLNNS